MKKKPAERATSVRIPSALWKRAKVWAAQNDITRTAVLVEALQEYLKKRNAA